jgi:cytochrome c553
MRNIVFLSSLLMMLGACSGENEPGEPVVDLAAGEAIARAACMDCHGMDGRGSTAEIPNLNAQSAEYLVEAMLAYRDGGRLHAALQDMTQGMSEADIMNIAAYYASQPANTQAATPQVAGTSYSEGATIGAVCEECHGDKGISDTEGVPSLAGQQPAYLIAATLEYQNGERGHVEKAEMMAGLAQVDIEKMAMYFAAQTPPARPDPAFGDPGAGKVDSAGCGKCHGQNGVSRQPLVPSLAAQEPVYLVSAIKAYRNDDRHSDDKMPTRTDEQIENLAAYYATQRAEASVEGPQTGEELAAKCDRCHHPASGNRKLNVPALRGQNRDYLVKAMKEYRREDRESSMMHKMSSRYSDEMIEALATYYSSH